MTTIARVVVVQKHTNGLPRDSFVNTYHFSGDPTADPEPVAERVRDFYFEDTPTSLSPLYLRYGSQVAVAGHEIRVYPVTVADGKDPRGEGFPPLWIEMFDHLGKGTDTGSALPSEVALCLSYRNDSSSAVPPARRRGRNYHGPFTESSNESSASPFRPVPSVDLQRCLREAGERLKDDARGGDWIVYSRPFAGRAEGEKKRANGTDLPAIPARTGSQYPVTSIWTDDSWDTQRRRGERAQTRTFA